MIQDVIEIINKLDDPMKRKNKLPDDNILEKYENSIGLKFPDDYKLFLKTVSNSFIGFISPFTLNDEMNESYNDLIRGFKDARNIGIPNNFIPICEDNGDYYCLTPDGSVQFWSHNGDSNEKWPDLATWAKEVWLEGR